MGDNQSKSEKDGHFADVTVRVWGRDEYHLQGEKIRVLRCVRGWSQQRFGEELGVGRDTIRRIERYGAMDGVQLIAIAKIFEVSLEFFGDGDSD